MTRDIRQAEHASRMAADDLVDAKAYARKALPEAKRKARGLARIAKQRRVRANRRLGKMLCNDYED